MEYGASAEDIARVCHAHPVGDGIIHVSPFTVAGTDLSLTKTCTVLIIVLLHNIKEPK